MKFESLLGALLIACLSLPYAQASAQSKSFFLYHLTAEEFADTLLSDRFDCADDLSLLKSFLEQKYQIAEMTFDEIKERVTKEDFEAYQKEIFSNTELAFSNPTCVCV
jgi:hypothetical protein